MAQNAPISAGDVATASQHRSTRIEQVLRSYPPDQRFVRFSFDWTCEGHTVRAILTIPTGTLLARTRAPVPDPHAAIDEVVEQLAAELRRHELSVRDEIKQTKKRRRERDAAGAQSHLQDQRKVGDAEGFFDMLRHLLRPLRSQARRELMIAQLQGTIRSGEVTVGEVLDQVLLRAWECWATRPPRESLDRWLVQLLHEVFYALNLSSPASLLDRHPGGSPPADYSYRPCQQITPAPAYAVEDGWAVANNPYWPFADAWMREGILPSEASELWKQLAAGDQERMIVTVLSGFRCERRQAFALHALEDWAIDEIADTQSRTPSQVNNDVDVVRHALGQHLQTIQEPN